MRQHATTGLLIEEVAGSKRLAGVLSNRDLPWLEGWVRTTRSMPL